jgi:hypothetical protein
MAAVFVCLILWYRRRLAGCREGGPPSLADWKLYSKLTWQLASPRFSKYCWW